MQTKFKPPATLVEKVAEFLSEMILDGSLKPGEQITEVDLNRRFGISRSPIREALRILEQKGLMTNIPRKGSYVRTVTETDIAEIFPVRAILEGFAARLSVPNLGKEDFEKLKVSIAKMKESANKDDFKSFLRYHYDFHRIFIKASKNKFLIKLLEDILNQALWLHQAYIYFHSTSQHSIEQHYEILRTFEKKDAKKAERLVVKHILNAINRIVSQISESNTMPAKEVS